MTFRNYLAVAAIFLVTSMASVVRADDLEDRVVKLEARVQRLETKPSQSCLTQVDGVTPYGTRPLKQDATLGWVYQSNGVAETFQLQIMKRFLLPKGIEAAVVKVYAPRYSNSCSLEVFSIKDLILY